MVGSKCSFRNSDTQVFCFVANEETKAFMYSLSSDLSEKVINKSSPLHLLGALNDDDEGVRNPSTTQHGNKIIIFEAS